MTNWYSTSFLLTIWFAFLPMTSQILLIYLFKIVYFLSEQYCDLFETVYWNYSFADTTCFFVDEVTRTVAKATKIKIYTQYTPTQRTVRSCIQSFNSGYLPCLNVNAQPSTIPPPPCPACLWLYHLVTRCLWVFFRFKINIIDNSTGGKRNFFVIIEISLPKYKKSIKATCKHRCKWLNIQNMVTSRARMAWNCRSLILRNVAIVCILACELVFAPQ